ncbi:MAG TPA: CheR family methyltransferase [Rhodocyclaceae bacterium]|nr:CheR family methyltransferase [Rhodocyclaceae bacterium]
MNGLAPIKALIKQRCGLFFDGSNSDKLAQALSERMAETGFANVRDYHACLLTRAGEFQALVNLLTINETYFFREPEQIRLLVEKLVPRFLARNAGPLRILSAGCSSGEEPYSLVMALYERYGERVPQLFSFAGGDIDTTVLARARAGIYSSFSFRGLPAEIRDRYFEEEGRSYRMAEKVRSRVVFYELNLFAETFPPALQGFDIVFFRNVSIYFDAPARKTIQQNLASLMKDDGILVIGTAETLANDLGVLPVMEEDGLFYFVKGNPPLSERGTSVPASAHAERRAETPLALPWALPPVPDPVPLAVPAVPLPMPVSLPVMATAVTRVADVATGVADLETVRILVREKRFDEALTIIESLLAANDADSAALLLKAHILINRKDFSTAASAAKQALEADAWSVDAFLLLGLAAKWQEQAEEAITWFRKAAYASQTCWPAHYYLGDLYRLRGDMDAAKRAYRVVLQLLGREGEPEAGTKVVPLGLPAAEIRFLCEHQLGKFGTEPQTVRVR